MTTDEKVLVHFDTDIISIYLLKNGGLKKLNTVCANFANYNDYSLWGEFIDSFLFDLAYHMGELDNERVRLYATGIFQQLSREDLAKLVIDIFVNHGLNFNVIYPDLEKFYLEKGQELYGTKNIMEGLVCQEFRSVVVCGSFQHHMDDIGDVMEILQKRKITVLSPWTKKIIPETLGTDFIRLEGQAPLKNNRDTWSHRYEHMEKFRRSDAIIVCNPGGIIGKGAMFELGYMMAISSRVIFTERPRDLSVPFPSEVGLNFS